MTGKMTDREILLPYLTEERVKRLEEVLSRRRRDVTLVLEDLHKEHNVDAVLRTCEAFGLQHVHVVPAPQEESIISGITQGCHHWLTIHYHPDVATCFASLRRQGFRILAGSLTGEAVSLDRVSVSGKVALVFANELAGASPAVLEGADVLFMIPLVGFSQSLNVSVAAGITLHQVLMAKAGSGEAPEPLPRRETEEVMDRWVRQSVKSADEILVEMKGRTR